MEIQFKSLRFLMESKHKESKHKYRAYIKFVGRKKRILSWDYADLDRTIIEVKKWLAYYADMYDSYGYDWCHQAQTAYIVDNLGNVVWGKYG